MAVNLKRITRGGFFNMEYAGTRKGKCVRCQIEAKSIFGLNQLVHLGILVSTHRPIRGKLCLVATLGSQSHLLEHHLGQSLMAVLIELLTVERQVFLGARWNQMIGKIYQSMPSFFGKPLDKRGGPLDPFVVFTGIGKWAARILKQRWADQDQGRRDFAEIFQQRDVAALERLELFRAFVERGLSAIGHEQRCWLGIVHMTQDRLIAKVLIRVGGRFPG